MYLVLKSEHWITKGLKTIHLQELCFQFVILHLLFLSAIFPIHKSKILAVTRAILFQRGHLTGIFLIKMGMKPLRIFFMPWMIHVAPAGFV
ncbi:MAG: hypothetical protein CMG74_01280 [Candidatus Marinimicrobia bacterium]|nr:hypothetical protein [Candidatus Neomarinimicrobiota bacterium]